MLSRFGDVSEIALALFFLASATAKLAAPSAVAELLTSANVRFIRPVVAAVGVSVLEIVIAIGFFLRWPGIGVAAVVVLVAFSTVLARAMQLGSRSRCGCLGDLTQTRVGPAALGRNAALVALAALTMYGGTTSVPANAWLAGLALAALVWIVPDAIQTVVELHRARTDETHQIRLGMGIDELL